MSYDAPTATLSVASDFTAQGGALKIESDCGVANDAGDMDGVDDYFSSTEKPIPESNGSGDMTFAFQVILQDFSNGHFITQSFTFDNASNFINTNLVSGVLEFGIESNGDANGVVNRYADTGDWHTLTTKMVWMITISGNVMKFYVDGVLQTPLSETVSGTGYTGTASTIQPFYIGRLSNGGAFGFPQWELHDRLDFWDGNEQSASQAADYSTDAFACFPSNAPPVVDNPIPDQAVNESDLYDFIVPGDTFSDPDLDELVLSATLDDDSPLPSWLSFNPTTEQFLGVASDLDIGTILIKVTATDPFAESVSDTYALEITENIPLKTKSLLASFRALLPDGRAWNFDLSIQFKQFLDGMMDVVADAKAFLFGIKDEVFPDTTQSLELWEEQFLLSSSGLTESERRANLEAQWKNQGGQSPTYLESVLAKLGIIAKVYENFGRLDPNSFLVGGDSEILINGDILFEEKSHINTCGNPATTCNGDDSVTAGEYDGFTTTLKKYAVSIDSAKWVHYFIVADPVSVATPLDVPADLERAFKLAILKVKPTQTRAILNVDYI